MFCKKLLVLFLMVLGQVNAAFGFDFKYTSQSTDVMSFFQDEIAEYYEYAL